MKAVILAAGTGTRLRPLTNDTPKSLLPVGGVPLIDRVIGHLENAGIEELVVVVGYLADVMERHLRASDQRLAREAQVVMNEHYHDMGNCYSLLVARDAVAGHDFIKCDGDVVLNERILPKLVAAQGEAVLVVDRGVALAAEEMKVQVDEGGRVVALNKTMDPGLAIGESIGIERIGARMAPALFAELAAMIEHGEADDYYERGYERLIEAGHDFAYIEIESDSWCEIDDADDLERARHIVALRERGDAQEE